MKTQTLKLLREGQIVNLGGINFMMEEGEIQVGDLYISERNSGPKLLIAKKIIPLPTEKNNLKFGGWIDPTCNEYSYDLHECVKVKEC